MGAYQLKITIKGSKPPIWRRVMVPDQITFGDLHEIIQTVFCWRDYHIHEFEFPEMGIRVADNMEDDEWYPGDTIDSGRLIDGYVRTGEKFLYTYDFGDNWEHVILVEKYLPDYRERFAQVVKYKGDVIPEDCGGIWGYYDLLETLADPEKTEAADREYGMDSGMG